MKRFLVLSGVIILMIIACGCNSDNPVQESSQPASQDESNSFSEETAKAKAKTLFENLDKIDHLGASAIEMDTSDTFTVDEIYTYAKVTDKQFTNLDSIKTFVQNTLTEKAKSSKYSSLFEGERPQYKEKDGTLYVLNGGRGCGYPIKGEITVSDVTDTSFTARSNYDNFGAYSVIQIKVVLEDEIWKIDEFTTEN